MTEISRWLAAAADRERKVVRLEDALLTDRYWRYFWFRLRYFLVRTLVAVVVHAIRIALLYAAFPREQFALIILLGAAMALINDAWWGALEQLREGVRQLRHDGQAHRIPARIGMWLRLALLLARLCAVAAVVWLLLSLVLGWVGPVDLYGVVLIGGTGASIVARAYHSGAYALRRIYRPLPSLVAVDIGGLMALLVLWPVIGLWAFPLSELMAVAAVTAMSLHYTSRTYRSLGLPSLRALVAGGRSLPPRHVLRQALPPALASTLSGLDSLLVLTVLVASTRPGEGATLVALLAALGPVIRAGFEWASLLYFDLVRLEAPLLSRLRERFDLHVRQLAIVIGCLTWVAAAVIGLLVLDLRDGALLLALLPFLLCRSLLAAGQVRAFVTGAYRMLIAVGATLVPVLLGAMMLSLSEAGRIAAVAVALLIAAAVLFQVRGPLRGADRVASLLDLIGLLRSVPGPVIVTVVRLDQAYRARGVTREDRDAETWRQSVVARRLAGRVAARGGRVAWSGSSALVWFEQAGEWTLIPDQVIAEVAGGLLVGAPRRTMFQVGADAAWRLAHVTHDAEPLPPVSTMVARFQERIPGGLVLMPGVGVDRSHLELDSRGRAAALRAALRYSRSLAQVPEPGTWDVSALVGGGALLALFLAPRSAAPADRRIWRDRVRRWDLRAAAEGPMLSPPRGPGRTRWLSRPSWSRKMGYR